MYVVRPDCEHVFVKPEAQRAARALRRDEGLPLRVIAEQLGVAKSSVSRWVRDIELTSDQHAVLRALNPRYNAQLRGRDGRRASAMIARVAAQEHGRELARRGDVLHAHGCMLYWAEGSKSRNTAALVNSDAAMLKVFLRFLRECYAVDLDRIALTVNCYLGNGHTAPEIVAWWLRELGLPDICARAPVVNRASRASQLRRGHVLPYGTARLAVHSTFLVQSIYGAIQEYGGFDRPEWLD